mgnify:FL=1
MIQTLNRIFELDAFRELNTEESSWLQEKSKLRRFKKGEFIYSPGNPSSSVLFVVEGRVKLGAFNNDGKEMIKHIFFQNELFGIMAISNQKVRANYSEAMDEYNEILEIDVFDMKRLMQKNASFSLGISKIMGDRLVQFQERIESLMFKDT